MSVSGVSRLPTSRFQRAQLVQGRTAYVMNGNSSGSGFFIDERHLATCAHVVRDSNSGILKTILGRSDKDYTIKYNVVCRGFEMENDVAILKTQRSDLSPEGAQFIRRTAKLVRRRVTALQSGESVMICGCPMNQIDPILTSGMVSASPIGERGQILVSAFIQPGNSGGPCFDSGGKIVGLVSSTHTFGTVEVFVGGSKTLETIPRNYGEIVPIQLLRDLAVAEGVPVFSA